MPEYRESYLVRIAAVPVARIWSGIGNLTIPADAVESAPATYSGAGELLEVPNFQMLINGVAERLEFSVSGVSAEVLALAVQESESTKGASVHLGRADFDADWQLIGVEWEAIFRADFITVKRGGGASPTRTISLSVGTADTGRSYAPSAFFTDAEQRLRSPTDRAFEYVSGITQGTTRRFGQSK